jgi:hypothetical protein
MLVNICPTSEQMETSHSRESVYEAPVEGSLLSNLEDTIDDKDSQISVLRLVLAELTCRTV